MWGTDLTRTLTGEGQVVVFVAVDHCSAECVGILAAQRATHFDVGWQARETNNHTVGQQAILRIVGDECRDKGSCTLPLAAIAARAGVRRKLAQTTIRLAR